MHNGPYVRFAVLEGHRIAKKVSSYTIAIIIKIIIIMSKYSCSEHRFSMVVNGWV